MVLARTVTLALLITGALVAWLWATTPQAPSSALIGLSADAQVKNHEHAALRGFLARLKSLAGVNARECGLLALGDSTKGVLSCSVEELSKRTPFWLAIQVQGVDSAIWTGLVQDSEGGVFRLEFDSDVHGGSQSNSKPSVSILRCSSLSFDLKATERRRLFICPSVPVP